MLFRGERDINSPWGRHSDKGAGTRLAVTQARLNRGKPF